VSKDRIIEVVAQVVSPEVAATLTKLKKSELVGMAEAKLVGLRWVPDNLKCAEQPK
jgi:ParB family chromosome partitioning protein